MTHDAVDRRKRGAMTRAHLIRGEVPRQAAVELGLGLRIISMGERELAGKV